AFLGYDIDAAVLSAGDKFHINYYWKCMEEIDEDYRVRVDLTDIDDTIVLSDIHRFTEYVGVRSDGLIDDMENVDNWNPIFSRKTNNLVNISLATEYALSGNSLKAIYHIDNSDKNDVVFVKHNFKFDDWSEYDNISLWVYNPNAPVITDRTNAFWIKIYTSHTTIYRYSPTLKYGSNELMVPFSEFKLAPWTNGSFDLEHVTGVSIGFEDPRPDKPITFPLYIDDLRLTNNVTTDIDYKPYLTSEWEKDDIIMEEYDLKLPEDIANGVYLLKMSLVDTENEKLPIVSGKFIDGTDRAIIARIDVIEAEIQEQEYKPINISANNSKTNITE
ncbi:MAG: hypothetical protein KAR23_03760, partial [Candidatus Aenigmarchaeota archaeon]|nr:hypothetical protein [Candidatus Aenigmarchaeota archaeon]